MIQFDVSAHKLPGSSRRLLEVGPGVVSSAGRMCRAPLCVVLLDEEGDGARGR